MTTSTTVLPGRPIADATTSEGPARWQLFLAFAAVYLIWGSTYLAILFAIETLPPFLMAGVRFLIAGSLLYGWVLWRGAPRPSRQHWLSALAVGGLLLMGGNGGVVWAEQRVPSGLAALMVALVPLWMALLDWGRRGGSRPTRGVFAGLALGMIGIALLVGPDKLAGGERVDLLGAGVLMVGSFCWATGSILSRHVSLPKVPLQSTAMQMLAGGLLLSGAGLASGEWHGLQLADISLKSGLALLYLIIFGSLVGFSAYVWLLRVSTPSRVSTYAYVNPVVAVMLGWAFAGEPLTLRTLLAAGVIVAAVVLITTQGRPRRRGVSIPDLRPR